VQVLKECITRAGGLEAGLRFYVGAANLADDGGYGSKVLSEQRALRLVASGKSVPVLPPRAILTSAPVAPKVDADAAPKAEAAAQTPEQIAMLR